MAAWQFRGGPRNHQALLVGPLVAILAVLLAIIVVLLAILEVLLAIMEVQMAAWQFRGGPRNHQAFLVSIFVAITVLSHSRGDVHVRKPWTKAFCTNNSSLTKTLSVWMCLLASGNV